MRKKMQKNAKKKNPCQIELIGHANIKNGTLTPSI